MSRCFGDNYESDSNKYDINEDQWFPKFDSPEEYLKSKLRMLEYEMYIHPTQKELDHLRELKTRGDIDRAVHSIIDRHWSEY